MPDFDAIVVGAGPAGSACALTLARKGANVLLLEKAKIPGERNMTGGVVYGGFIGHYGLVNLVPGFEQEAPLERKIVSHEVTIISEPDWNKRTFRYYRLDRNALPSRLGLFNVELETGHDFSVLRRKFDQWFAVKAVEEGAMLSTQTTVEELLVENGMVSGVRTTKEELRAKLVIDCSGATSNLVEMAQLRKRLVPRELYHGIKHVYKLDPTVIETRFKAKKGEGRTLLYFGEFMKGVNGGAFIYTNLDTLSVGLVVSMDSLIRETTEHFDTVGKLLDVLEEFEAHPMIAELLAGGELLEYSAHNIPKSYKCMLNKPYTDGFLVAGDALGAFVKIGPLIDGMRRGIASGIMAAEAYLRANETGSFKASNLARYKELLGPIYEDVARSGREGFFSESYLAYHVVPKILFSSGLFSSKAKISAEMKERDAKDAVQRVQVRTSLLNYDEDKEYSHITVDNELAGKSVTKPWIPACPVNCYTLLTPKGVFASYKDLYQLNLASLDSAEVGKNKRVHDRHATEAFKATLRDVADGEMRFDYVACVACGTCGAIGPKAIVAFNHERDGHGVRYRYG